MNEPIFSMLTGKNGGTVCIFGDGGCSQGVPSNWVYFYPEGTNGVESGYYSSNSNGDCTTPECFCPYVGGSIYSGSMVNGHPDICPQNNCPTDCSGYSCPSPLTMQTGIGNRESDMQNPQYEIDYACGDFGQSVVYDCQSIWGPSYDIVCYCMCGYECGNCPV